MDKDLSKPEPERRTPDPVFSPAMSEVAVAHLLEYPEAMVRASDPTPERRVGPRNVTGDLVKGLIGFVGIATGLWFLLRWGLYAVLPDGLAFWLAGAFAVLGGLFVLLGIGGTLTEQDEQLAAREWHGRYLSAADWDDESAALMLRAQDAVRAVEDSEVNGRGLLDAVKNDVVLPEQLWDLGRVLQQVSVLRAQQAEIGKGLDEAQLDQVLGAQRRALKLSAAAMEAKVVKLEQYAQQVRLADAVLRAEAAAHLAAADSDRYLELLATTEVAGSSSVLDELSADSAEVKNVLARSLAAALETGQLLAEPDR
ncbi:hypothetical protein AB0P21_38275 [Kribbella sp. NPDC056861]|uniref:hypothetical protein n=1 Tax=Kribbella sp. NPDC056861 TaxID=3154857 RepID=UPI00343B8402